MNFEESLLAAVKNVRSSSLALIIAGILVFAGTLIAVLGLDITSPIPYYVFIAVSAILIIIGIMNERVRPVNYSSKGAPVGQQEELLRKRLKEAELTLEFLEAKAAAIPGTERPVSLTRDIATQSDLVQSLREKLSPNS